MTLGRLELDLDWDRGCAAFGIGTMGRSFCRLLVQCRPDLTV